MKEKMKNALSNFLKCFAICWGILATIIVLIGMLGILISDGLTELFRIFSPFNFINCGLIIILFSPSVGAYYLSKRLIKVKNSKEDGKNNQKGFIQIPLLIVVIFSVAVVSIGGYGGFEYYKISKTIGEIKRLTEEEKYSEAIEKLKVTQNSLFVKNLGLKRQEMNKDIEANRKNLEDKLKYDQGLSELNNNNFQGAIDILSTLQEDSLYYQKAQTKIEESKRMIVEGKLTIETVAKLAAEAEAEQEAYEKKLKEQELADKEDAERMMSADNDGDGLSYREELSEGTSDFNKDSDADGINDKEDINPAGGGRYDAQYFSWNYENTNWEWTYSIHEDWYQYYKNKPRLDHGAVYVTYHDNAIKEIAEKLKTVAQNNDYHKSSFVVSFIQGLPYVEDYNTGYDELPKYPIETLIDRNGDCEDTSYLAAAIIRAMGFGCVLIELPGHMAIGVSIDSNQSGTYYEVDGRHYYYFETTAEGWSLGDIPSGFSNTSATIIKIPSDERIIVSPQYVKPCYVSSNFPGYYFDGENYYSDSQCNYLTYCIPNEEYYINPQITTKIYWDSSCSQEVLSWCAKSTYHPGYFYNTIDKDIYTDCRCTQKATFCRNSPNYSDAYYDGYNEYWDSNCTQKVVSWCSKSTYRPEYFFNSLDYEYYLDSECNIPVIDATTPPTY